MLLPLTSAIAEVVVLDSAGSTNDELIALAVDAREFLVVVTTNQTSGRGRLGRDWVAPPGQSLAASVLLRPGTLPVDRWGWIPLIAGLAMARSVARLIPSSDVLVKWPNDVLVGGRKISGILAELLPGPAPAGLVLGAGLNLAIPSDALPTPTSTSLSVEGATLSGDELVDAALCGWLTELRLLYTDLLENGSRGIRPQVSAACSTLGQRVRVQLPGGADLIGTAVDLDESGRIVIRRTTDAALQAVAAGDVTHLRYE